MDDLAHSVDPSNKTRDLENEIRRITLWRMDDLERELHELHGLVPLLSVLNVDPYKENKL
jgi:hypothetical protein